MKNQITTRDIEQLSAYLDNQLSSKDRSKLEARLKTDPELRNELQEINRTRLLLRNLPKYRAPRNYYVKAEAVRQKPSFKLAPVFGVVSAVASVLLVVMLLSSRLISPTSQVALAPAASIPTQTMGIQQETRQSETSPLPPVESAPMVGLGAPEIPSPTPYSPPAEAGETELPTPTTIYLNAYPPSSTPFGKIMIGEMPTETPTPACAEFIDGQGDTDLPACPSPTSSAAGSVVSMLPYETPTITATVPVGIEAMNTAIATETATATATETPTTTPTATETPTPTATPAPTDTQTPLAVEKAAPVNSFESATETSSSDQQLAASNTNSSATEQAATPAPTPIPAGNSGFLSYILLSAEISLAAIAILAGITAIILRSRAR